MIKVKKKDFRILFLGLFYIWRPESGCHNMKGGMYDVTKETDTVVIHL